MADADYIIVGSGINALVAAALLGKKGRKVVLLERNAAIGGCLRTEEITLPGYRHDVMATTMVLFLTSPAFGAIGKDLEARGLEFCHAGLPTGVLRPDGSNAILAMDRARNIAHFDALSAGDGQAFDREMGRFAGNAGFVFGLLGGNLWSFATAKMMAREAWKKGLRGLVAFLGEALSPARNYLEATYRSEEVRALFAPWALHCGLGPESAYSAEMVRVIGFAIEAAGCPIVKGGAANLLTAFERLIRDQGGEILTGADVEAITVDAGGRATGVTLASGRRLTAASGVIASVTPHQLYERLLAGAAVPRPADITEGLSRYRYGKGNMQIHYALKAPPRWRSGEDLSKVALLHLTPGLDGVSPLGQRGRTRPVARRAHRLRRTADRTRSEPGAGRRGHSLAATARYAPHHQGRCRRPPRLSGRWSVDGGAARGLCRSRRGDAAAAHREFRRDRAGAPRLFAG